MSERLSPDDKIYWSLVDKVKQQGEELTALRAEVQRLTQALTKIAANEQGVSGSIARAALAASRAQPQRGTDGAIETAPPTHYCVSPGGSIAPHERPSVFHRVVPSGEDSGQISPPGRLIANMHLGDNPLACARLVMAQLAHVHGLAPIAEPPPPPGLTLAELESALGKMKACGKPSCSHGICHDVNTLLDRLRSSAPDERTP